MLSSNEQNIIVIYELSQVETFSRFLIEHPEIEEQGYALVPTKLEIEHALTKKNIAFRSVRPFRPTDISRYTLAEEWSESFDGTDWKWFQYRNIQLSHIFFLSIRSYFLYLLYFSTILKNVLTAHPQARRLIVFPSTHALTAASATGDPLVREQPLLRQQLTVVVTCARLIGTQLGIEVLIPETRPSSPKRVRLNRFTFSFKRTCLEIGVQVYNAFIGLLRPRGAPRILASDYWRNVAPIMSQLPRGELILFDRAEALKAGIRNLWRSRVRLYNFSSFSIRNRREDRRVAQELFEEQWRTLSNTHFPEFASGGFSLRPQLFEAFDQLLNRAVPQLLRDIDGAYALLQHLRPDTVFLRASISMQTHFSILALVARECGIPSLELQHGLEYLASDSYSKRHSAEYIAVYGKVVQDEFVALGFPREKIPIIGSPRFDAYTEASSITQNSLAKRKGMSVLCVGSAVGVEPFYDEYHLEDYYTSIAHALEKIPDSSIIIKMRQDPARLAFYSSVIDRIFARVPHTIVSDKPFPELFQESDMVVSYYSTVILEALQFKKPVIVFSTEPIEMKMHRFHLTQYAEAGGLLIAYSAKELYEALNTLGSNATLRAKMGAKGADVLSRLHSFDGNASKRTIELITRLTQQRR